MGLNKKEPQEYSSLTPIRFLKHSFHTVSLTILTLLLPLSFLLLARLSHSPPSSVPSPSTALLCVLVSILSLSSLLYSLSNHQLTLPISLVWAFLFIFQLCVSLGIESTTVEGIKTAQTWNALWFERAVFFLGMYETMLHWSRMFVRPVIDDTIFGGDSEEEKGGRAAIGVAFGALWVWVLRDDVEPLLAAVGTEGIAAAVSGWDAFFLWFVSYTTVVIGAVRVVEVVFLVGKVICLFLCGCCGEVDDDASLDSVPGGDEV